MGDMKESRERGSRGTVFRPSVHCHDSVESCDDCLLEVDGRTDGLSIPGKISAFAAHGSRARQSGIMHYSKRCSITHSHGEIPSFPLSSRVSLLPAPSSLPLSPSFNARHSLAIYFRDRHHIAWTISASLPPASVRPSVHPFIRPLTRPLGNPVPPSASSSIAIVPG